MATANLNITVLEKRMLRTNESATYCGLTASNFKASCPVQPIVLHDGKLLYDKRDLDAWIDGVKTGDAFETSEDIIGKLE